MTKAVRVHKVGDPKHWSMRLSNVPRLGPARYASVSMPSASISSTCITVPACTRPRDCHSSPAMKRRGR